jgi:hypothetical protein
MKQKSGARDRSYIADLRPMCQVAQCHWLIGITSSKIKGCALSFESWVWWLALLVAQLHRADQHGWRVGLVPTCSEWGVAAAQTMKRSRRLAWHTRSWACVLNGRFIFLFSINGEAPGARFLTLLFWSSASRSWNRPSSSLILTDSQLHYSSWLVEMTMVSTFRVRVLAIMADNHCLARRGWTLPPVGPHRRPGGVLFCIVSAWVCLLSRHWFPLVDWCRPSCHTQFLCQNQVLSVWMTQDELFHTYGQKCSQITKYHE